MTYAVFHLATLFARREVETRIRLRDRLKLAGEKIRCEQAGSVRTFLSVHADKVTKWKTGFIVNKYVFFYSLSPFSLEVPSPSYFFQVLTPFLFFGTL